MKKLKYLSIVSVFLFFVLTQIAFTQNYKSTDIIGKWDTGKSLMIYNANGTFVQTWKSNLTAKIREFKGTFKILNGVDIEMKIADGKPHALYTIKTLSEDKKKLTISMGSGAGTFTQTWTKIK